MLPLEDRALLCVTETEELERAAACIPGNVGPPEPGCPGQASLCLGPSHLSTFNWASSLPEAWLRAHLGEPLVVQS